MHVHYRQPPEAAWGAILIAKELPHGKRMYYSFDSIERAARQYMALPPAARVHYEVLRVGVPTRFYLDLECVETEGAGAAPTPDARLRATLELMEAQLALHTPVRPEWVVFEACLHPKVSFHVHALNMWCVNNYHVGACVRAAQLAAHAHPDAPYWIDGKFFADCAVYTMHRIFRLCGSHKLASIRTLRRTPPAPLTLESLMRDCFLQSPRGADARAPLAILDIDGGEPTSTSMAPEARLAQRGHSRTQRPRARGPAPAPAGASAPALARAEALFRQEMAAAGASPTPDARELDILTYTWIQALHDRRCPLTHVEHKSNHIYCVVRGGEGGYALCCHDPECRAAVTARRALWPTFPLFPSVCGALRALDDTKIKLVSD